MTPRQIILEEIGATARKYSSHPKRNELDDLTAALSRFDDLYSYYLGHVPMAAVATEAEVTSFTHRGHEATGLALAALRKGDRDLVREFYNFTDQEES